MQSELTPMRIEGSYDLIRKFFILSLSLTSKAVASEPFARLDDDPESAALRVDLI